MTAFQWGALIGSVALIVQGKRITKEIYDESYEARMTELKAKEDAKK